MAGEDSSKSRTPWGSKLPAKSLADALAIAQALNDYAVPASKAVIAGQRGETTSSSHFKQRFASAGYYGLVEKDGDKFKLTARGEAALDGDNIAKRTAVMATGFGPIIGSLATRAVSLKLIESRLKSDHAATESGAAKMAPVLIESAEDAGLIANDKFDAKAIESVDSGDVGPNAAANGSGASSSSKQSSSTQKKRRRPSRSLQSQIRPTPIHQSRRPESRRRFRSWCRWTEARWSPPRSRSWSSF